MHTMITNTITSGGAGTSAAAARRPAQTRAVTATDAHACIARRRVTCGLAIVGWDYPDTPASIPPRDARLTRRACLHHAPDTGLRHWRPPRAVEIGRAHV